MFYIFGQMCSTTQKLLDEPLKKINVLLEVRGGVPRAPEQDGGVAAMMGVAGVEMEVQNEHLSNPPPETLESDCCLDRKDRRR
ncbi:hypothetical protein GJAV_G00108510 [Gymnothorax javanicus]|nr:hypothetical protein GJAV_G00108510 [Gymnothorax javanicus]